MTHSDNKLYLYEDVIDLVVTTDNVYVDNRPMNNRTLKLHKGVTNELMFNIRNRDRKLQNVFSDTLRAYMIDSVTKTRILTRHLIDTSDVGKVKLIIEPADIENIEPGLYYVYITRSQSETIDAPVYSDQNNNMKFQVEVTDQLGVQPVVTQETSNFLQTGNVILGDDNNTFVTSALYGNLNRNFPNAQHTMALYLDEYTGLIKIQASCFTSVPDSDDASKDWFTVKEIEISDLTTPATVTNFVVNCNWIRVLSLPTNGSISKVMLRN